MHRHILVPLDGSTFAEEALRYARDLAIATGARLTLLAVMPRPGWAHVPHLSELDEVHRRLASEYLAERVEALRREGVARVGSDVAFGDIALAIASLGESEISDVDLIVMSTHGIEEEPGITRHVLLAAPAPVLVVQPRSRPTGPPAEGGSRPGDTGGA